MKYYEDNELKVIYHKIKVIWVQTLSHMRVLLKSLLKSLYLQLLNFWFPNRNAYEIIKNICFKTFVFLLRGLSPRSKHLLNVIPVKSWIYVTLNWLNLWPLNF